MQEAGFDPGSEDPLEKETAAHSSILAWESVDRGAGQAAIRGAAQSQTLTLGRKTPWRRKRQLTPVFLPGNPWTEEPGRLPSVALPRVRH